jgi:hypothetical protein
LSSATNLDELICVLDKIRVAKAKRIRKNKDLCKRIIEIAMEAKENGVFDVANGMHEK